MCVCVWGGGGGGGGQQNFINKLRITSDEADMAELGMTLFSIPRAEAHSKKEKKKRSFYPDINTVKIQT